MASEGSVQLTHSGAIKQFHIFGREISFSMSPAIHNTGFQHHQLDCNYSIIEIGSVQDCLLATAHEHYGGASVTMPYKLEVTKYCDIFTHERKLMAAANTLSVQKGANGQRTIKGDNTDWSGILNCIRAKYLIYTTRLPKMGWVIDADGAARAAIYVLHKSGVEKIFISNRTRSRGEAIASKFADQFHVEVVDDWEEMNSHPADIVVGTIPVDTILDTHFGKVQRQSVGGLCIDMSYRPRVTPLLSIAARASNWEIANGIEVLLEQGYVQYQKWTGLKPPKKLVRNAVGCD
jgi:shikimate-5-dehydrogenase